MIHTAPEWYRVLVACSVKPTVAATWSEVFAAVVGDDTFRADEDDIKDFLGQILHESDGLTHLEENLNYSAQRLTEVWPGRFPTLAAAQPFARNPRALADKVYNGRMGNTGPDDGWNFRGRTPIQITGHDNYAWLGKLMGLDLVSNPDALAEPRNALRACIAWWESKIPDSMLGDVERVTRRVNGGLIGLAHREKLTDEAGEALDAA